MQSGARVRSALTVWALFAVLLAGMTWIAFIIAGLRDDVATERSARNALVQQVKDLGEKPVVGPAGPQGTPGQSGKNGSDGITGTNGANGKDGTNGRDGSPGQPGRDGELGAQGEKGATGERGETGATGPAGPTGPTGATGDPGPSCPTGYTLTEKTIEGQDTAICVKTATLKGH